MKLLGDKTEMIIDSNYVDGECDGYIIDIVIKGGRRCTIGRLSQFTDIDTKKGVINKINKLIDKLGV